MITRGWWWEGGVEEQAAESWDGLEESPEARPQASERNKQLDSELKMFATWKLFKLKSYFAAVFDGVPWCNVRVWLL